MPMTSEEFAFNLKQKYPQYRSLANADLVSRVVARYPQYRSEIIDLDDAAAPTPQPAGSARTLAGATGISETPWYQQHPEVAGVELPSAEGAAEWLPAALAAGATGLVTKHPAAAAAAGGVAGEAARQLFRRAVGAPAATGMVQEAMGSDPNSPEAAAEGFVGEAGASLVGSVAARALKALSGGTAHSAERAIVRDILGGARTEREIAEAPALAKRAQAAGIVNPLRGSSWSHRGRLARAQEALKPASADAGRLAAEARAAGATVEAQPVLDAIQAELPTSIPGSAGRPRRIASAERRAVGKLLDDELEAVANTGGGTTGTRVPIDTALGEIGALDDQLEAMYRRGALDPAIGKKAIQTGARAWRTQLRQELPELADARLKQHELLTINSMLQRVVDEQYTARGAHEPAALAGSAAVGRYGPAAAGLFKTLADKSAPLSIPARQILAKILSGGARTAQLWVRAAELYGLDDDSDTNDAVRTAARNRAAQAALQSQAKGVIP